MSLLIPAGIFLASVLGITLLVMRKFPYLRRLTPEVLDKNRDPRGFWGELFPEAAQRLKPVKLIKHRVDLMSFFGKIVSSIRILFRKVESRMKGLAENMKRKTENDTKIITNELKKEKAQEVAAKRASQVDGQSQEGLKQLEQDLIIEVAKNPKNPVIYEKLADVYVKMGQTEDAIQSMETAVKLNPENKSYQNRLHQLLGKNKS
jgi:tetratricopeptide (TPR) repeat protein